MTDQRFPSQWPALLGAVAALVLAATGCCRQGDPYITAMLDTEPHLADRPVVVTVPAEEAGQRLALGNLDLGLPRDWRGGQVRLLARGTPCFGYGDTVLAPLTGTHDSQPFAAEVAYRPETSSLRLPEPGLCVALSHATADPEKFLRGFPTDLALFEAAHNARPADLEGLHGRQRERLLALLVLKRHWALPPVRRLVLAEGHAFAWTCEMEPAVMVDLFDRSGTHRGQLSLIFPERPPSDATERITDRLLTNLRFGREEGEGVSSGP